MQLIHALPGMPASISTSAYLVTLMLIFKGCAEHFSDRQFCADSAVYGN